ncbi:hypothetical protein TEA_014754 [Camellia sinensis var. sinensis]|uniref:Protein kinase domain-containing protein n=2 Tax=Camellia sinensis TaxID=4442 RepID=A0A4S4EN70_CAMSN|nr:hypothetical protein TEA_014754 [Camellia sinensis var. sinensis]
MSRLLFFILLFVLFLVNCDALRTSDRNCDSSSCGNIQNIRYPFRYEGDPENCGNKRYELACHNNHPLLDLPSAGDPKYYYVQAINYNNYTIRVVDMGIQNGSYSSLPLYSLSYENFTGPAFSYDDYNSYGSYNPDEFQWEFPCLEAVAVLVECENPVNSPLYMNTSSTTYTSSDVIYLLTIIGFILGARTFCRMLCLFAFLIYKFRTRHLSMFDTIEGFLQSQNNLMPIRYSYWNIKMMTKGFKDKLGEGGFGCVYKGKLRSDHIVAINILNKHKANGQDFINEVATIGRIHDVNVVKLIGFCADRSKRALVYDFMPNGSLEKYIFSQEGNISLSYKQMYDISRGVARGIEYLHRGCDMQILHFDIKPHNILLDENFTPKVSNFGLAKLYPTDNSNVYVTAARGTMGYMALELFYKNIGRLSYKVDVYSFGMLMEMAGRRRNLNAFADHTSQIYFPSWVYDQFKEGKDVEMGESTEEERQMIRKMIITALWCIQMKHDDRPATNKVVEMLEGNIELVQMPPKPFLTPQEMPTEDN